MIDDFYQAALERLKHHLDESGVPYSVDDGALLVNSHRLELSITFEGFAVQGEHTLAPLDIQIHLDGDDGDRFRVGTLGIGADRSSAMHEAISEWHLLAAAPLLSALGASVDVRRARAQQLAGWDLFAGRVGIRGAVPAQLRSGGAFFRTLIDGLRQVVSKWERPNRFELRSIFVMATCGPTGREVQAAINGHVNPELIELLSELPWPASDETYLFKQLFILRHAADD